MPWKRNLFTPSFRGIPFRWTSIENSGGRKTVVHEFPLREEVQSEDLGRRPRQFTVACYVQGPDYMDQRDSLLDALEQGESGILVHPYRGNLNVNVMEFTQSESTDRGNIADFNITFVETGEAEFPAATEDQDSLTLDAALDYVSQAQSVFLLAYNASGFEYLRGGAEQDTLSGFNMIKEATKFTGQNPDFQEAIDLQIADLSDNVIQGDTLFDSVSGTLSQMSGLTGVDKLAPYRSIVALNDFGKPNGSEDVSIYGGALIPVNVTTANRQRQADNQAAISLMFRELALTEACKNAVSIDYDSYEELANVREELADIFEELILEMGSLDDMDDKIQSLETLRSQTFRSLNDKGANLARVVPYELGQGTAENALGLAYRLYNDVTREQEIIDRNKTITHPGYLPAGETLEVLSS